MLLLVVAVVVGGWGLGVVGCEDEGEVRTRTMQRGVFLIEMFGSVYYVEMHCYGIYEGWAAVFVLCDLGYVLGYGSEHNSSARRRSSRYILTWRETVMYVHVRVLLPDQSFVHGLDS